MGGSPRPRGRRNEWNHEPFGVRVLMQQQQFFGDQISTTDEC